MEVLQGLDKEMINYDVFLAPIVLFAFNRLEPLKDCVDSLLQNTEAAGSDLIVFVDGPRTSMAGEVEKVQEVRDYVCGIAGFKSLEYHFSEENNGLGPSIIAGVTDVIMRFGRAIVIEDDLIASSNMLAYINQGLDEYCSNDKVFSISAYSNKVKAPRGYEYDVYFAPRGTSWGWATWKDRWLSCDWELKEWKTVEQNAKSFNRWGGSDCFGMLKGWKDGRNKSWAIRFCYNQFIQDKVSAFPLRSKIKNNGFDGSGTNCKSWNREKCYFDTTNKKNLRYPPLVELNNCLVRQYLWYFSIPMRAYGRIMNFLSRFFV